MSDPNLTTFQGRMCTKVRRQVTNTAPPNLSTSTSTTSTSTSTSTTTSPPANNNPAPQPQPTTSTTPPAQNPPPANTPSASSSTTAAVPRLPFRPPDENPQVPPPPPSTSTSTSTTSTSTTTQAPAQNNPPPAQTQRTSTSTSTTPIPVVVPAPIPDGRNTQLPQVAPGTPNTGVPVQTSPPSGGQQRPPTDPGAVVQPPAQGGGSGGESTPIAVPIAQPQVGGSQPVAQPDTNAPIQVQPVPILAPSGRTGATTISESLITHDPITSTTILRSTATDGSLVSITSAIVVTPSAHAEGDGHSGSDHSGSGASHSGSDGEGPKVQPGAVVGAVFGVISFLAIAGLLFFCFRRRRNSERNSGTPLIANSSASSMRSGFSARFGTFFAPRRPSGESFSNAKAAMSEKVHAVFAVRQAADRFEGTKQKFGGMFVKREGSTRDADANFSRQPTPNLERGMRDATSPSVYSNGTRNRASSVPAMAFRERAMGLFKPRSKSRPMFGHKRETSDISFVGDKVVAADGPPRLPSPVAQHRRSTSSVADFIQSWNSTDDNNNPFRDPDASQPLTVKNADLSRSNTQRSVAKLTPILQSKAYNQSPPLPSINSFGIGVATSGVSPVMKSSPQIPRHERSFSQARIQNPFTDPSSMARPVSPTSIYTTADSLHRSDSRKHTRSYTVSAGRPIQRQPSKSTVDSGFESAKSPIMDNKGSFERPDSDPMKQWHMSGMGLSSQGGYKSMRSSVSSQDPFADDLRISDFQFFDNSPDLSSSRPVTSQYPSYIMDRQSRVSDPFDLDRPEVLAGMKPTWSQTMASRATSISRRDSSRSRGTPITPSPAQKTNPQSGYFLSSDVYRP